MGNKSMYCLKCYSKLDPENEPKKCPYCSRPFDPSKKSTYLKHPFPSRSTTIFHILMTTLIGILVGCVVAWFQMTAAAAYVGGH
jgi:hypothetical protein